MKPASSNVHATQQKAGREAMIVENLEIVNNLARQMRRRVPPCVTFDDLAGAGTIGLIEAVDRFDLSRGLKFKSYAQHRIRGAMLDFLRNEDPLSRDERRRIRHSDCPGPVTISLDQLPAPALNRLVRADERSATESTLASEVRAARGCLAPREKRVIEMLFDFGCKNRRVAAELKVNESRVSQIKTRAIAKLRVAVGDGSA